MELRDVAANRNKTKSLILQKVLLQPVQPAAGGRRRHRGGDGGRRKNEGTLAACGPKMREAKSRGEGKKVPNTSSGGKKKEKLHQSFRI
jgi:hypothetical protein